jgi:hypothetical protein
MNKATKIKFIMKNPEAMEVMDKHVPGFKTDKRLKMAANMTIEAVLAFLKYTEEQKSACYADIEKFPE